MTSLPRSLLLLALLYTALNCVKPLIIDDAAYWYDAEQISRKPLDPYGFAILWYNAPQNANSLLAPAVLPYFIAPAVRLFGDHPMLVKLWLLPMALLFVWALYDLFRRFARGLEVPLTWMTVLSPAFLPSFNLMLDVPALALSLAAIAVFLRSLDRNSIPLATLAGLLGGLAMQTKYTALLAPAVMLVAAVVWRKPALWLPAVIVVAQVFVSWELLTALLYGQSHFLLALRDSGPPDLDLWTRLSVKARLILPLLGNVGGVAPAVFLLALAGMGVSGRWLLVIGAAMAAVYAVIACTTIDLAKGIWLEYVLFIVLGFFGVVVLLVGVTWTWMQGLGPGGAKTIAFLVVWLLLETLAYYPLTPFPAVRRVMGIVMAGTFLAAHLAARTCTQEPARRKVRWIAAFGVVLGLGIYSVDLVEAWTQKLAAEHAAGVARSLGTGQVWFVGHWGFQHYGEAAGMKPLIGSYDPPPDYVPLPPPSDLAQGDTIVVPIFWVDQQRLDYDPEKVEPVGSFAMTDVVLLRTVWSYYSGFGPLTHRGEPERLEVIIYRVKTDCTLNFE
jgi:hypothetical protein